MELIILDEILGENVRFLRNEVKSFWEFYNRVDRWEDRRKVLFLCKGVEKGNGYFGK